MITLASNNNGYDMLTIAEILLWHAEGGSEALRRRFCNPHLISFAGRIELSPTDCGVVPQDFGRGWTEAERNFRRYVAGKLPKAQLMRLLREARGGLIEFDKRFLDYDLAKLATDLELIYLGLLKRQVDEPAVEAFLTAIWLEERVLPRRYAEAA